MEARLAVHVLAEFRRDFLRQRGVPIQRHEVKADIALTGDHGAEEERLALVAGRARFKVIAVSRVGVEMKIFQVRCKNPLQRKKDVRKFGGSIGSCGCRAARRVLLGHRSRARGRCPRRQQWETRVWTGEWKEGASNVLGRFGVETRT